ncbi:2-(R)-hydroxypropyl-CoM dehydrogenase [compost metagenome]
MRRGAYVAAVGRYRDNLENTCSLATGEGQCRAFVGDVSSESDVMQVVSDVVTNWGRIDVLVNNAGVLDSYDAAHTVSLDDWNRIISINLTGPFLMAKYVIPHMLKLQKGSIVNIASVSTFSAAGGGAAYTAAKHVLHGLTRQLCFEYGSQGIRVNSICPGATATPMAMPETKGEHSPDMDAAVQIVPAKRWCMPEEIAKLTAFLAGDDADYIHGSAYVIDGGWLTAARDAF